MWISLMGSVPPSFISYSGQPNTSHSLTVSQLILHNLVEILSKEKNPQKAQPHPKFIAQKLENIQAALNYVKKHVFDVRFLSAPPARSLNNLSLCVSMFFTLDIVWLTRCCRYCQRKRGLDSWPELDADLAL